MMLFSSLAEDTNEVILYFDVRPLVQTPRGNVTAICTVLTSRIVTSIRLHTVYPSGIDSMVYMQQSPEGKYVYTKTYESIGKYSCYIVVFTTTGRRIQSPLREFWITTDIEDIDNDGMPNWWEDYYHFNNYYPSDALEDADGDGYTNGQEFQWHTNPLKNDIVQNALHRLEDNRGYLGISLLFVILLVVLTHTNPQRGRT
jgi:hypothetical protein